MKTALFVDFDNIYLGLRDVDTQAAEVFATEPGVWLDWIHRGLPGHGANADGLATRSMLVRKVYLNPRQFGDYQFSQPTSARGSLGGSPAI